MGYKKPRDHHSNYLGGKYRNYKVLVKYRNYKVLAKHIRPQLEEDIAESSGSEPHSGCCHSIDDLC
jgi:hypothetical protein